jgi:hypothetical protein
MTQKHKKRRREKPDPEFPLKEDRGWEGQYGQHPVTAEERNFRIRSRNQAPDSKKY